jgi:predicted kinase
MQVIILRGLPGSGKSTFTRGLAGKVEVCSADHFFETSGTYRFEPSKIGDAHASCLRRYVAFVTGGVPGVEGTEPPECDVLVVDNTNLSNAECAPYYALAQAFGYPVKVVTILSRLTDEELSQRNVHGVLVQTISRMRAAMERESLPPWWEVETVG